jgi:hypothetical protein
LSYIHAKYVAHTYNMPLLYKPFPYSDQLMLDRVERRWHDGDEGRFANIVVCNKNEEYAKFPNRDSLYIVHYFPDFPGEFGTTYNLGYSFAMDWNAEGFLDELRSLIKPINPVTPIKIPKDCVSVAVHARRGFLNDSEEMKRMYFLKFPPEKFYTDQIKRIGKMFYKQKLFVYIFTDDPNPKELVGRFREELKRHPVQIAYRRHNGDKEGFLLEDFFGMMQFDCIIRAEANISYIAAKLAEPLVEIYPVRGHWEGDQKVIDEVKVIDNRARQGKR